MSPLLEPLLARPADAIALIDERGPLSWGELLDRALRMAALLCDGAPSLDGARVAILARQDADWVAGGLGVLLAGGLLVPLSPAYPTAELSYFADDAEVAALIVSPEYRALAAAFAGRRLLASDGWQTVRPMRPCEPGGDDPAILFYTSGTTGRPKGAILTHANLGTHARLLRAAWQLDEGDRLLHALPLHHLHGLVVALLSQLSAGGSALMLPRFDPASVVARLGAGDISVYMAVPTMYQRLREYEAKGATLAGRLVAPRLSTSGSAALPVGLGEFWAGLTGAIPLERYGMTEIGVAAANPLAVSERRPGTVGWPLPSVELRLAEGDEVWVRGPSVFAGYWRRPDATREAFVDGWFKTGDVGAIDAGGYLRLLGRTSQDILKSGGYKLSALEIEEVLREHEAIGDVAVIGLPDERWGDLVVAIIERRPGSQASLEPERLREWAKTRLAAYKAPRQFIVVDALPRNPMGKVLKAELRRHYGGA